MKITDLQVYGTDVKTFTGIIEGFDKDINKDELYSKSIIFLKRVIKSLGYDLKEFNSNTDIEVIKFIKFEEDNSIIFTYNMSNLL